MTLIFNYPWAAQDDAAGQDPQRLPTLARMLGYADVEALKAVSFWDLHSDPRDRTISKPSSTRPP
jgi:hypothetical protein